MRTTALLLLLGMVPQEPFQESAADPAAVLAELWRKFDGDDVTERKAAFHELQKHPDPAVAARLKRIIQGHGAAALKKAGAERARALRAIAAASRKSFNPLEFAERQKAVLAMLAAGNTKAMEKPVKEMWKEFYFEPEAADDDEKFMEARDTIAEWAWYQRTLGTTDKESLHAQMRELFRSLDEQATFVLFPKKDQKIMMDNAALREKVPASEYRQIWQTNLYRILVGKTPLKMNPKLCDAAREHSKDMLEHKFFAHESPLPGKRTPSDRATRHGASASGENIFMGDPSPEAAFWAWFGSLGHHQNMLREYAEIGVGSHEKYWTQMFG